MRYHLAVLVLFAVLPGMNLLAAPVPPPSAILDIGPPPKGETAEQYLKDQIEGQTFCATLNMVCSDPEVKKLPSVAARKDPRPWLAENLRVTEEKGGRRLRFTFRAGTPAERVTIINAFLRVDLFWQKEDIKCGEEWISTFEKNILDLKRRIQFSQNPQEIASCKEAIDGLRTSKIPIFRAAIDRTKQYVVIRWAR